MLLDPLLLTALGVGLLSAGLCAYIGNFVLMKNMTFIAMALSQIAALGVVLGFLLHVMPDLAALAASVAAALLFWYRERWCQGRAEGTIGFIYVTCAALVLIVVSLNPRLEAQGIDLVSGNLLYSTGEDLGMVAITVLAVGLIHAGFRRQFLFVSFDAETAQVLGQRARSLDLLLMLTIAITVAFCMKLTGMLFVFASLVVPGLTALTLAGRVRWVFTLSVAVALAGVLVGTIASFHLDLPTSPTIICCYAVVYLGTAAWRSVARRIGRPAPLQNHS